MGLKADLILQRTNKAVSKYTNNIIRNWKLAKNLEGLHLAQQAIGDSVSFSNKNRIIPLNRNSQIASFFGITDFDSINKNVVNHLILALEKEKENIFMNFPCNIYLDNTDGIVSACKRIFEGINTPIQKFKQIGAARLTFNSKLFGQNGNIGAHTIGLVFDKKSNRLYVLDSKNDNFEKVKQYKNLIEEKLFSRSEFKDHFSEIIYSTKPQQFMNEYTCNNWSVGNIEKIKKELAKGNIIKNSEELNQLLPDDINKILEEQYNYVIKNKEKYAMFL